MKKVWSFFRRGGFVLLLALILLAGEVTLRRTDPVKYMTSIWRNDYELIALEHPDMTFRRAVYGSSVVISGFMEERSRSGYANLGMDYGTIQDLMEMLDKGLLTVEEDLVIALNDSSFMDTMDTNESYPWHREWYQPYLYFQRDRLEAWVTKGVNNWLRGEKFISIRWPDQQRAVYRGALSDEKLAESEKRIVGLFGDVTLEDCRENFAALDELAEYCREKGICLRALWMPWNGKTAVYPSAQAIMDEANARLARLGIPTLDLTHDKVPDEWLYDMGHLSYEEGAPAFTDYIDPWLLKEVETL